MHAPQCTSDADRDPIGRIFPHFFPPVCGQSIAVSQGTLKIDGVVGPKTRAVFNRRLFDDSLHIGGSSKRRFDDGTIRVYLGTSPHWMTRDGVLSETREVLDAWSMPIPTIKLRMTDTQEEADIMLTWGAVAVMEDQFTGGSCEDLDTSRHCGLGGPMGSLVFFWG